MQISSETTLDEYIDLDAETITSEPAVDPTHVDWQQECCEKGIAEVFQSEYTALISDSDDEIANDEKDVREVTASEALDSLDAVKCFAEIYGDKQKDVMLNELIGKVEKPKLQDVRQSSIYIIFKKWSCKLSEMTYNIVRFLPMMTFSSKKSKTLHSEHFLIAHTFFRNSRCLL